jgi:tRNA (cytidine/uridine-2'-O-)-methyltransferase
MKSSDISGNRTFESWSKKVLTFGRPEVKQPHLFNVALVEPEIPQNTGNIGRTCVGAHCQLHLVGNLGFAITDNNLKRAGLDYWDHLTWTHHQSCEDWQKQIENPKRVFYFSAKADLMYDQVQFQKNDWFVFGRETQGLPEDMLQSNTDQCLLIPLLGPSRGLNVATAVAVIVYEGIRQLRSRGELDSTYLEVPWGKL